VIGRKNKKTKTKTHPVGLGASTRVTTQCKTGWIGSSTRSRHTTQGGNKKPNRVEYKARRLSTSKLSDRQKLTMTPWRQKTQKRIDCTKLRRPLLCRTLRHSGAATPHNTWRSVITGSGPHKVRGPRLARRRCNTLNFHHKLNIGNMVIIFNFLRT
jgi:hypothetical protein